ncbi:MAG: enterochelin esterase-like enzyme [Actinomycetes bacterium]|jgi:enterochelin esterase-like enzyme
MESVGPVTLIGSLGSWFDNIDINKDWTVYLFVLLIILTGIWCWRRGRKHKRWYFWPLPLVLPIILLGTLAAVNVHFGLYNRMGDLYGDYPFPTASVEDLQNTKGRYLHGISAQTTIPGTKSGIDASDALIWFPPQYFEKPVTRFPVVYLIPGTPGYFTDWALGGNAIRTAQTSAGAGQPTIIVQPNPANNRIADTECVNGAQGNWQDYLAEDVPDYVNNNFRTLTGAKNQAMAGLSMGGYCAQIISLRNPTSFGFFGNFAGSTMPTYDTGMAALFGPVANVSNTVNSYTSTWVITNKPESRTVAGQLYIGKQDQDDLITDEQAFVKAAKSLGMDVDFVTFDGDHSFSFWSAAFEKWLPWALSRMGSPK